MKAVGRIVITWPKLFLRRKVNMKSLMTMVTLNTLQCSFNRNK